MSTLAPGTELGPFRLVRPLGRGSYGDVYEAEGGVALKVLRPDRRAPQFLTRFRAEAETLAILKHPNVVRLVAPLQELPDKTMLFGLELLTGGSLETLIAQGGYTLKTMLELAAALAAGLAAVHEAGFLHRDVAPSNILLDAQQAPRLCDFGMVRAEDTEEGPTPDFWFAHGDPEGASPERLFHIESGETGDAYSLGAVLFALYTRTSLFKLSELSFLYNLYTRQIEQFFRTCLNHELPCPKVDFRPVYKHYLTRARKPARAPAVAPSREFEEVLDDLIEPDYWKRLQRFGSLSGVRDRLSELKEEA